MNVHCTVFVCIYGDLSYCTKHGRFEFAFFFILDATMTEIHKSLINFCVKDSKCKANKNVADGNV